MYGRPELSWRKSRNKWHLHAEGRSGALLKVVSDDKYAGMYRITDNSGRRSDMVNFSRARDCACSIALKQLNS